MLNVLFPEDVLETIAHAGDVEHAGREFAREELSSVVFASIRNGAPIVLDFEDHNLPERYIHGLTDEIFSLYPFLTFEKLSIRTSLGNLRMLEPARRLLSEAKDKRKISVVAQRTQRDCSLCCFAMAMRLSYEEAVQFVEAVNDVRLENSVEGEGEIKYRIPAGEKGWTGFDYETVFEFAALECDFQPRNFRPREPAIFSVHSRVNPDGFHAVYYENGEVYDPTTTTFPYTTLQEIFSSMKGVYQWINGPVRNPAYPR